MLEDQVVVEEIFQISLVWQVLCNHSNTCQRAIEAIHDHEFSKKIIFDAIFLVNFAAKDEKEFYQILDHLLKEFQREFTYTLILNALKVALNVEYSEETISICDPRIG